MGSVSARVGVLFAALSVLLIGLLHLIPPSSQVSAISRTISEYALLPDGWVFDSAVLALAVGSVAVLLSLVGKGLVKPVSPASVLMLLWSACLVMIVLFPKHNWAVGPSSSGTVHRIASIVAFLSLPLAAIAVRKVPVARVLGIAALLVFGVIIGAVALQPVTGIPWWQAIPLGAVERLLAFIEVAAVVALALVRPEAESDPVSEPDYQLESST